MARSNAHRTLQTLVECGWAVQDAATSAYRPSLRLFELGALRRPRCRRRRAAAPAPRGACAGHRRDDPPRGARRRRDRLPRQVRQPAAGGRLLAHRRARAPAYCVASGKALLAAGARLDAAALAQLLGTLERAHAEQHHRLRRAAPPSSSARARAAMPRTARSGGSASAASARRSSTRAASRSLAVGMSVPSIRFARSAGDGLRRAAARPARATRARARLPAAGRTARTACSATPCLHRPNRPGDNDELS